MSFERAFRDLISGRTRGLTATILRGVLRTCAWPYSCAVTARNRRFDRRPDRIHHVSVPVISVGNLTMGGTGKTPMVAWLAHWWQQRKMHVVIISRGYAAQHNAANDEALELAQRLPHVRHLQDPDRVRAARQALSEHTCDIIVLDDGFQHRRLHRDVDIVLLDALAPFGHGHVFPRGMLREPISGLARADVLVLTRAASVDEQTRRAIRETVQSVNPLATWAEADHRPTCYRQHAGHTTPLSTFSEKRVAAFCGIGNPDGFRHTLQQCGVQLAAWREFPDHCPYNPHDLIKLQRWAERQRGLTALLCTEKDLVKICRDQIGEIPLWALTVELVFTQGRAEFESRVSKFT